MSTIASAMHWLTTPTSRLPEAEQRRVRLLVWLLLSIMLLTITSLVIVLMANPPGSPRRQIYTELILALFALVTIAYALNHSGRYYLSAGMTVAIAVLGPWGSLLMDRNIISGDFVPLTYVAISVLLSSILLPTVVTIILASAQCLGLLVVVASSQASPPFNWPSFMGFVLFTSVLSILAKVISQRDLKQIDDQARQLALNEAQLRELSIRDHLTKLFNRRYLEETLEREIQRARRKQSSLGLIMLDIDHFKNVNDTLGHAAGDSLLQGLGKLLSEQVRRADVACRYGGDEFVLILPEASLEVTRDRAELLRMAVKCPSMQQHSQQIESITLSIGVAIFPEHGATSDDLLKSADSALYRAKRKGRDHVVTG